MAFILDLEEAKAVLSEQRKSSDPYLKSDGLRGTVARSFDIHETLTLWRIGEANRQADPNDIMTAMFNVFANAIAAELETNSPRHNMEESIAHLTAEFQHRVKQTLSLISQSPSITAKEAGTA